MKSIAPFASLLTLVASTAAQIVSPRHFTRVEGNGESYDPLTSNQSLFRYQQVHDDLVGTARSIASLGFRLSDSNVTQAMNIQAALTLSEAAAGISATNLSTNFAANHGANRVDFPSGPQSFPTVGYAAGVDLWPRQFTHRLMLPTPYAYSGARPLVWEIQITARQNTGARGPLDVAFGSATNPNPWFVVYSNRTCRIGTGFNPVALNYGDAPNWANGNLAVSLSARYLAPNQPAVVSLGVSNTSFAGLPLPYELPGSATAPSGPCVLAASMDLAFGGTATATGVFPPYLLNLPLQANANGRRLFFQAVGLAPGANPAGLVTSDAAYVQIVAPFAPVPVGTVALAGQLGATGSVTRNSGLIVELR